MYGILPTFNDKQRQKPKAPSFSLAFAILVGSFFVSCPLPHTGAAEVRTIEQTVSETGFADDDNHEVEEPGEDGGVDASIQEIFDELRLGREVAIDPSPMALFFDALASMKKSGEGLVRILHYGDSHTAADFLTTVVRRALQKRFGDGGRGFVFLGKPWRSYMPKDVEVSAHGPWQTERILIAADPASLDGLYGLGGVAVDAGERNAWTRVSTAKGGRFGTRMSSFEVYYMEQPNGGSFLVRADGKLAARINTKKRDIGSGFYRLNLDEGAHEIEIKIKGNGIVRLFGAVVENNGPGIVYDTLGINGAFFYTPLRWDAFLLREQVERRNPNLIITMYGANEADSRNLTPQSYAEKVKETLRRLRAGAPEAACMLMGPTDRVVGAPAADDGKTSLEWIIQTQREISEEVGCAFLDLCDLMGGPGSNAVWQAQGLAQPDGIHLTIKGYTVIGELIAKQIIEAFSRYLDEEKNPGRFEGEEIQNE
jgi:lysophospholipase L1-like esterase